MPQPKSKKPAASPALPPPAHAFGFGRHEVALAGTTIPHKGDSLKYGYIIRWTEAVGAHFRSTLRKAGFVLPKKG